MASLEPEGEVRGELFLSGHHDSARIFNFLVHQPKLYALRVNGGIGTLLLLCLCSIVLAVLDTLGAALPRASIVAIPFTVLLALVSQLWFFASGNHTPGAGDNLASTATAWEFLKMCSAAKAEGRGFRHLRITSVSWDAEESGLRGSRAWRRQNNRNPLSHRAWNLNLECLYNVDDLFLLTSDINGNVELSIPLAQKCSRILAEKAGRAAACKPIAFLTGGTDAGEMARAGVEATTLMGMPWATDTLAAVYHTPGDTIEAVSVPAIETALVLADNLSRELDEELCD
jgi:Zn-dependent M28 family amino/carboxypeptidase